MIDTLSYLINIDGLDQWVQTQSYINSYGVTYKVDELLSLSLIFRVEPHIGLYTGIGAKLQPNQSLSDLAPIIM